MNSIKKILVVGFSCVLLASCAARISTQYYDLSSKVSASDHMISKDITLGIGPVTLPQLLDRPGIVSRHHDTGVNIASYHVWAGELEPAFTRVLVDGIATTLKHDTVWASPWDNRFRPEYQLRLFVDRFSGEVNGQAQISLSWTLLGDYGKSVISTHRYQASVESGKGYQGYVDALNQLLAGFVSEVAVTLVEELPRK
jgi:uncharacterized lipoprotein YmbA